MGALEIVEDQLGRTIPADTSHAVSVSLPSWRSNVGYEEGEDWVVSKMTNGYPRFFVHKIVARFAQLIAEKYAHSTEQVILFQTSSAAERFLNFLEKFGSPSGRSQGRVLELVRNVPQGEVIMGSEWPRVTGVVYPKGEQPVAKAFWQHTGEGMSSRKAEYCLRLFEEGALKLKSAAEEEERQCKAPKRYRKPCTSSGDSKINGSDSLDTFTVADIGEGARHVEERFGRNLNIDLARNAKTAIKRRIIGSLKSDQSQTEALELPPASPATRASALSEDDVYLYPCGMNSIYHTHRNLTLSKGLRKSICFGFPYVDTLKVLEKFGPGCLFYGNGVDEDLDDLEQRLKNGERYLALFCEFPSNPLLRSPNLQRIRALADVYEFAVVIDETIGNFLNVRILPYADILVSSLTKIFSGDSNVMGGCAILNPDGTHIRQLKAIWSKEYEDSYWPEDAIFMERNSRDFVSRISRINVNAEAACDRLRAHPRVKEVFYPKVNPSRPYYDACRTATGGYGGLLSATFYSTEEAATFYDNLDTEKGPSLGTNFTLASPFVLLAHYTELDWAAQFGADKNLVRFSIGLEDTAELLQKLDHALDALTRLPNRSN